MGCNPQTLLDFDCGYLRTGVTLPPPKDAFPRMTGRFTRRALRMSGSRAATGRLNECLGFMKVDIFKGTEDITVIQLLWMMRFWMCFVTKMIQIWNPPQKSTSLSNHKKTYPSKLSIRQFLQIFKQRITSRKPFESNHVYPWGPLLRCPSVDSSEVAQAVQKIVAHATGSMPAAFAEVQLLKSCDGCGQRWWTFNGFSTG